MRKCISLVLVAAVLVTLTGCASRTQTGGLIGAGSGAVVGGLIGNAAGNTAAGAIIGAAVGGAAGAWIGHYMDEQAAEIERDLEGAKVERIGEGIKITFDSGILFAVKTELKPAAIQNLSELAVILNKYADTNVLIEGHTDAAGKPRTTTSSSRRRRAQSVSNRLATNQVNPTRFTLMGYGEGQPVASNETSEGRQLNRRVEIAIYANDKLKKTAAAKTPRLSAPASGGLSWTLVRGFSDRRVPSGSGRSWASRFLPPFFGRAPLWHRERS